MSTGTSIWQDIKGEFNKDNTITKLIFINIIVFIVMNVGFFILNKGFNNPVLAANFYSFFTLPADLGKLITRPWTIITHMFAHAGIFHILFNMLWLFWMGKILREYIGDRKILPIYIYGALTGALFYILFYNLLPGFRNEVGGAEALGASAAVMAIIVATATLLPDYTIFLFIIGPVKLKWIAVFAIILDIVGINGLNAGGSIAHMGGAVFGFIFIRQLQSGNDLSRGFNIFIDKLSGWFSMRRTPKVAYKNTGKTGPTVRKATRKSVLEESRQEKLDAILDKIHRSGYDSLTEEEKEFLFRVSKDE